MRRTISRTKPPQLRLARRLSSSRRHLPPSSGLRPQKAAAAMPLHHLMVGTWTPPGAIFTVQFDDEKLELTLLKRTEIPHDEPISWMTFDHAKKNIYGAAMKKWSSFAVKSPTEIVHEASHPLGGDPRASSAETNTRAIFLVAARHPPYAVYANPFYDHAGFGNVLSVSPTGALAANAQDYPLDPASGVHGAVFSPDGSHLYSADMGANRLWCHRVGADGRLEVVGWVAAPAPGDKPRWVAIHPSGRYLYALMEAGNRLCEYVVDPATRMPVYTHHSYPLIPPGIEARDRTTGKGLYRADVCAFARGGRHLFATARANRFDLTGYIAAFRLADSGRVERQLFLNPTPTSGGHSNAVAPADWSDEWLALTDDQEGWIEIYRWRDEFLSRACRLRIPEPGFGMNAIWYD